MYLHFPFFQNLKLLVLLLIKGGYLSEREEHRKLSEIKKKKRFSNKNRNEIWTLFLSYFFIQSFFTDKISDIPTTRTPFMGEESRWSLDFRKSKVSYRHLVTKRDMKSQMGDKWSNKILDSDTKVKVKVLGNPSKWKFQSVFPVRLVYCNFILSTGFSLSEFGCIT